MSFIGRTPTNAALTASDLADGIVGTAKIAADAVTAAKIADNAVVTAAINADAVTDAKIADDIVGTEHLTANEVDTAALKGDAVTSAELADDAVDSEHYTDGSIDTAHLADGQVTTAKLATAVFTAATDIGAAIVDADLFLMDDGAGGTIRKTTAARIKTYAGGGGKILQVVTASESAARSVSSTSYVNSSNGLSVDITPAASNSKIYIIVSLGHFTCPGGQNMSVTVFRDSTNLAGGDGGVGLGFHGGFGEAIPFACHVVDSPSSTSELTYQVYAKVTGSSGSYGHANTTATITAMEIGA